MLAYYATDDINQWLYLADNFDNIFSSTTDASDLQSVSEILKKLDLDSADFTTEQKLNALCLIFKETVAENVRYVVSYLTRVLTINSIEYNLVKSVSRIWLTKQD
jgi:hypothetical protein